MIPHPQGWTVTFVEDAEILIPPEGLEAGAIRYLEGLTPVRSVAELVEAQLAEDRLDVDCVGPARELITGEGEYAALVTVTGTAGGEPMRRDLGYVFCDDHYARVGAVTRRPALFARFGETVEYLVRQCTQMLGVRRRRFRYDPPPAGWRRGWACGASGWPPASPTIRAR